MPTIPMVSRPFRAKGEDIRHVLKYGERQSLICHFHHESLPTQEIMPLLCPRDFIPSTDPLWI